MCDRVDLVLAHGGRHAVHRAQPSGTVAAAVLRHHLGEAARLLPGNPCMAGFAPAIIAVTAGALWPGPAGGHLNQIKFAPPQAGHTGTASLLTLKRIAPKIPGSPVAT